MTSDVQKQAMAEWRNQLRRVEFSMPGEVFEKVGVQADKRNISPAEFILEAIETALNAAPRDRDDDRSGCIEARVGCGEVRTAAYTG